MKAIQNLYPSWSIFYHMVLLKGISLSFVFNSLIVLFFLSNSFKPYCRQTGNMKSPSHIDSLNSQKMLS